MLGGEAGATLLAAPSNGRATGTGVHAPAKAVAPLAASDFWLIGSLHKSAHTGENLRTRVRVIPGASLDDDYITGATGR